jgi:hypothetical protein
MDYVEPEFKANYGRKHFKYEEQARSVKDAFQWDDSQQLSQKKAMIEKMQKSPDRWATE